MNKAIELAIEARATTIVQLVNACFSDNAAFRRVKTELIAFAAEVESNALELQEQSTPPKVPVND